MDQRCVNFTQRFDTFDTFEQKLERFEPICQTFEAFDELVQISDLRFFLMDELDGPEDNAGLRVRLEESREQKN